MIYFVERAVGKARCHGCNKFIAVGSLRVSVNIAGTFLRHLRCRKYEEIPSMDDFRPTKNHRQFTPQDKEDIQRFIDSLNNKKRKIQEEIEEEENVKKQKTPLEENENSSQDKCYIDTCPNDILGVVFRFLDDLDDIKSSIQVSKKWKSVIDSNEELWKDLCDKRLRGGLDAKSITTNNFKNLLRVAIQNKRTISMLHYAVSKAQLSKYGLGEKDIIKYNVRGKIKEEIRSKMYFDYTAEVVYYAIEDIQRAQKKKWNDWLEGELLANNLSLEHKLNPHFEDWLKNGSSKVTLRNLMKSYLEKNGKKADEEPHLKLPSVSEINKMTVKQLKETLAMFGVTPNGSKFDLQLQLREHVSNQSK